MTAHPLWTYPARLYTESENSGVGAHATLTLEIDLGFLVRTIQRVRLAGIEIISPSHLEVAAWIENWCMEVLVDKELDNQEKNTPYYKDPWPFLLTVKRGYTSGALPPLFTGSILSWDQKRSLADELVTAKLAQHV